LIYFDSPIRRLWVAYYKYSQPLDAFSRHVGYVWIRQPRENGYGYMAVRDTKTNQPFGKFE